MMGREEVLGTLCTVLSLHMKYLGSTWAPLPSVQVQKPSLHFFIIIKCAVLL